jgi:hypothetical protein
MFVQTLVAQATIERFHKAIPLRLPRGDVVPLDPCVLASGEDGMTGQLGAPFGFTQDRIVADHHARQPARLGDGAQLANNPPIRQRGVDDTGQAFPAVVVDDARAYETAGRRPTSPSALSRDQR